MKKTYRLDKVESLISKGVLYTMAKMKRTKTHTKLRSFVDKQKRKCLYVAKVFANKVFFSFIHSL